MRMHVIFGRPRSGKTGRIIEDLNASNSPALLFSLENPGRLLRERGLRGSVLVRDEVTLECLEMEDLSRVNVVGLDTLQLLDEAISISDLCAKLQAAGVDRFVVTCHLRRDLRPASEERLIGVPHTSETL